MTRHDQGEAWASLTLGQYIAARWPALEPWYDWGIMHCEAMKDGAEYRRYFFELEWLGLAVSFQIGRIRREAK